MALKVLLLLVAMGLPALMFSIQNWNRKVDVSFDWFLGKVQTTEPMALPLLIAVGFLVGMGFGLLAYMGERFTMRRRVLELEQKLVRANVNTAAGEADWT